MEDQVWRQAMDNLYLLSIPTSGDIITKNECSLNIALKCMSQSFSSSECFSNIYNERLLNSNNKAFVLLANKESFLNYLKKCSINEAKKINLKFTALPIRDVRK
uniref:LAGLIDADG homing endonuclease n=1 Tax=Panagrolaimus sp. PS1159 TaxID=55785 RepID=A0AC35FYM1_9BILA